MYGMVNKFIEQEIVSQHGASVWQQILVKAGMGDTYFVAMEQYPDEITVNILMASESITGTPAGQLLFELGANWISHTHEEYSHYFSMGGDSTFEFLSNLNDIHQQLGNMLPELRPPAFNCELVETHCLQVDYISERPGLEEFVKGLFSGLAKHFGENIQAEQISQQQNTIRFLLKREAA